MPEKNMLTFNEIYDAYLLVNAVRPDCEAAAYVNVADEKILVIMDEEFCDDIEQREADEEALKTGEWIELPEGLLESQSNKYVYRFAAEHLSDNDYDYVVEMFTHRGAYSRWRDFLRRKRLINEWHQYEEEQEITQLKTWLEVTGIPFSEEEAHK